MTQCAVEDNFLSEEVQNLFGPQIVSVLRSIISCMYCGIVISTNQENAPFVLWNKRATEILGKGPMQGDCNEWPKHYGLFYPEDKNTPFRPEELPLIRALKNLRTEHSEMYVKNEVVQDRFIRVTATPLLDQEGVIGGVAVFQDITAEKTNEQKLRAISEQVNQLRDMFESIERRLT